MFDLDRLGSATDLAGYAGAGIIGLAYFLNQHGSLRSNDWRYPASNLFGSCLVTVSLLYHFNAPSLAIEMFWSVISVYGIAKNLRAHRLHEK